VTPLAHPAARPPDAVEPRAAMNRHRAGIRRAEKDPVPWD